MKTSTNNAGYGSDERESAVFIRRVVPTPTQTPGRSRRTLALLVTGALVVTFGAAFVALHTASPWPSTVSFQSVTSYVIPPALQTGREFLLRVRGANDLCMDDGGAVAAGQAKLAPWACNPSNINQMFVYSPTTYQIRSAYKTNLCLDANGVLQLQKCNAACATQRFTYNASTLMIRAPAKNNFCLDDGSAVRPGTSRFSMYFCDATSAAQRFEFLFVDDAQTDQQRVIDAAQDGTTRFQIRAVGKSNQCVDDDGAMGPGDTQLRLTTCNPDSVNQLWVWDRDTKRIQSAKKRGLCLDDGRAAAPANAARMMLATCDAASKHQSFVYDNVIQGFRNPNTANLCIDDGGAWLPTGFQRIQLGACDMYNANQHFEYVLVPPPPAVDAAPILLRIREFSLKLQMKGACLDDGGGVRAGDSTFVVTACKPFSANQLFVYDTKTNQIRSKSKANLCLDDGGVLVPNSGALLAMDTCDPYSPDQRFVYNPETQQISNPLKTDLCLDDGGGGSGPGLRGCDSFSASQLFDIWPL